MSLVITNKQLDMLKKAYKGNKEDMKAKQSLYTGREGANARITDYECGYNNALEYVFLVLGIDLSEVC